MKTNKINEDNGIKEDMDLMREVRVRHIKETPATESYEELCKEVGYEIKEDNPNQEDELADEERQLLSDIIYKRLPKCYKEINLSKSPNFQLKIDFHPFRVSLKRLRKENLLAFNAD